MKAQSLEFNIGVAFAEIEKKIITCMRDDLDILSGDFVIPKCWFGLRPLRNPIEDLKFETKIQIETKLQELFQELTRGKYTMSLTIAPDMQYIRFGYIMKKKPDIRKRMTVSDIEKLVGCKVEIIAE